MITLSLKSLRRGKDTYDMSDEELVDELMEALKKPIKREKRKGGKQSR